MTVLKGQKNFCLLAMLLTEDLTMGTDEILMYCGPDSGPCVFDEYRTSH